MSSRDRRRLFIGRQRSTLVCLVVVIVILLNRSTLAKTVDRYRKHRKDNHVDKNDNQINLMSRDSNVVVDAEKKKKEFKDVASQ